MWPNGLRSGDNAARCDRRLASDAPLILTADLPQDMQSWATGLRDRYFPPERNQLKAHVTLFHALPPSCEGEIRDALGAIAAAHAPVPGRLEGLMSLGRGNALKLTSPAMVEIWEELADRFHGLLTPQDGHKPRLHVTIQNKVTAREAKELNAMLAPQIVPRNFRFRGLSMHAYRGGPWDHLKSWSFRG